MRVKPIHNKGIQGSLICIRNRRKVLWPGNPEAEAEVFHGGAVFVRHVWMVPSFGRNENRIKEESYVE